MSEFEKLLEQTYAKLREGKKPKWLYDKSVSKDDDKPKQKPGTVKVDDKKEGIKVKASSSWRDAHENEEDAQEHNLSSTGDDPHGESKSLEDIAAETIREAKKKKEIKVRKGKRGQKDKPDYVDTSEKVIPSKKDKKRNKRNKKVDIDD